MWLRVKIFTGYLVLIALLAFTVFLLRGEQQKRSRLQTDEAELLHARNLAEQVYAGLLELATRAETVSVWDEEDLAGYRDKRTEVCRTLQELGPHIRPSLGQARIDSLCLLLEQKEQLLDSVTQTFDHLQRVGEIVSRKIPAIVSHVRQTAAPPAASADTVRKPAPASLWSRLFKRKEKKSAYLEQREKTKKRSGEKRQERQGASATGMLRSLSREVTDIQKAEEERLLLQMDLLYENNTRLNGRLRGIVQELESETAFRIEERYRRFVLESDRSFHTVSVLAISISLLAIVLYFIIHRDLKRKYRYQKELEISDETNRQLLQSKKDMMLAIAHDLRSPLATISGSADLLPGEKDGRRKAKYVENIRHASEYMLSLVNTLMDFYLLDTGQTQSYERIFHLESLFKETADNYAPLAQRKSLRLSTCFSGTDVVVCGDKGHLQQIVNNLLSNAVKFTKEGSVRMEAEYRNGELRLSVRDTGTGMDGTDAERIFTAFERLENARGVSGFGLGLAICSRLVSQMGGSIRVESRKGKGSDFIVLLPLPLADGKSPLETEKLSSGLRMEGTRVLLLDDDLRQLGIVREMLRRHRAACDCCQDSSELISRLRENEYDVLLMDIQMPDMDGFAVLELLRRSNIPQARAIPVIALTARMDDEREYLARGFAGCIRKPFTMESLVEGVTRVTGKKGNGDWKPDFSLILTGEDNRREMLEVFITEGRKDLSLLHEALEKGDRETVRDILHKNLPLWDTLRLDFPIEELRRITTTAPGSWTAEDLAGIREIERAANRLLRYAINMRKEEQ
ncbi:ATP-binding response regulator [Bacteroides fragilis]|uniref:ATP-binding response regulator n=1 Tax=Bacteroides fragilis TaxID=817 RepID=UPI0032ED445C